MNLYDLHWSCLTGHGPFRFQDSWPNKTQHAIESVPGCVGLDYNLRPMPTTFPAHKSPKNKFMFIAECLRLVSCLCGSNRAQQCFA